MCCLFPTRNYSTIWDLLAVDSIVTAEEQSQFELTMKQIKEYGDVFIGDGCLEGEYKIEIDERVEPVKWVPVVMMTSGKVIKDLQTRVIIIPVEKKHEVDQ